MSARFSWFVSILFVALAGTEIASADIPPADTAKKVKPNANYHFNLTKGKGRPVSVAYEKLLNTTSFSPSPFCGRGRPEDSNELGFQALTRVPLSRDQIVELFPRVESFNMFMVQEATTHWPLASIRNDLSIRVWKYDPEVDIENSGHPENVILWEGSPLATSGLPCGLQAPSGPATLPPEGANGPQYAYVLTPDGVEIDEAKTRAVFGHPAGQYIYKDKLSGKPVETHHFRPIGRHLGVFKFRDLYYFDTFYDEWGDFDGNRVHDRQLAKTLAVFLRQHNQTRQVCEYQLKIRALDDN